MVIANQALHENTKVIGSGVEAILPVGARVLLGFLDDVPLVVLVLGFLVHVLLVVLLPVGTRVHR